MKRAYNEQPASIRINQLGGQTFHVVFGSPLWRPIKSAISATIGICVASACCFAWVLTPVAAIAQGATSTELQAAYCLGVNDYDLAEVAEEISHFPAGAPDILTMGRQNGLQDERRRYAGYLMSTGALAAVERSPGVTIGLVTAQQRGRAERAQCEQQAYRQCVDPNDPTSSHCTFDQMIKGRSSLPLCIRSDRCSDPDKVLPFPFGQ